MLYLLILAMIVVINGIVLAPIFDKIKEKHNYQMRKLRDELLQAHNKIRILEKGLGLYKAEIQAEDAEARLRAQMHEPEALDALLAACLDLEKPKSDRRAAIAAAKAKREERE